MGTQAYNRPLAQPATVGCLHCDLLQTPPALAVGAAARCPRCDKDLWRRHESMVDRTLALSITAAIVFVVANSVPMLTLNVLGRSTSTTVIGGAQHLWQYGRQIVAVLVLFTAVIAPAAQIALLLTVALESRRKLVPRWVGILLRYHPLARTWSMIEVMMIGVLVALVKIADYAAVTPGLALFVLGALVFLLAAMEVNFDAREIWERIEWAHADNRHGSGGHLEAPIKAASQAASTAMQLGTHSCSICGLVSLPTMGGGHGRCPRCDQVLTFRKPDSVQRTWAFLIAAAVCYVPANVLPVLMTSTAAGSGSDTILQGVILLWTPSGWPLSIIVLVASIMIPSVKILALAYLLFTVRHGSIKNNEQRVRLYRAIGFIGRWSMVDVFVDTFTAAVVQFQPFMEVEPAPGLFFFAAVVVFTMLAVDSFDPRLIWDATNRIEVEHGR
jgi:paraquat-inducible protein A